MTLQLLHSEFPYTVYEENIISFCISAASLRLPLGSKLFQGIATMTFTRLHTRPSQKDLGCVVYPLNNKSLVRIQKQLISDLNGFLRKPPGVELIPCRRKPLRRTSSLRDPAQTQV
jgi:hypothetical protein